MRSDINFNIIFKIISRNLFILSASLFLCVPVAINYNEPLTPFILTSFITIISGLSLFFSTKKKRVKYNMGSKEAFLIVTITWLIISLLGCLPYIFSGSIPVFINAFFESVAGFTTTGSSILSDIESLPMSILFWRSLTHWIGGIGIIVLVIIIMPKLQIAGYHLFILESSFQEKILPRVKNISMSLLIIYIGLTATEIVFLLYGKMNLFESVCHAFGTIATGGFSPKNDSIAGYSSYIQYVIMVFMFLGGTNFVIHYYLMKGQLKKIRNNEELRFYLFIVLFTGTIITAILFLRTGKSVELSFREAFFQVVSVFTCTGYTTADYMQWPVYAWLLIFMGMFLGGSTGSTAGGIKMARHLVFLKNIRRLFKVLIHPSAVVPVRINRKSIGARMNSSILTFISIYFIVFLTGVILMVFIGVDIKTSGGSVATCMAGIGPGIYSVGPAGNFAHLPALAKLLLSILMIFGRLEIYPVLILFTRHFWRDW